MTRIVAALAIILCAVAAQARTLSPAEFTARFADALRSELRDATITVQADLELAIKSPDGKGRTAFLDNAYREYAESPPSELGNVMRKFVEAFAEQERLASARLDRSLIVPIVKDRQWFAASQASLRARGISGAPEFVSEPYNDDLVVFYAEDSPKNIRYLIPQRLDEAGISRGELRALAVANLKRMLPKIEMHNGPLVSMITAGGSYEASLLLMDEIWSQPALRAAVDGDVVVAIPARDLLFFTGSRSPAGIARLREIATKSLKQASYTLTDTLFVRRNGKFSRFDGN